jgi:hypothetical protein
MIPLPFSLENKLDLERRKRECSKEFAWTGPWKNSLFPSASSKVPSPVNIRSLCHASIRFAVTSFAIWPTVCAGIVVVNGGNCDPSASKSVIWSQGIVLYLVILWTTPDAPASSSIFIAKLRFCWSAILLRFSHRAGYWWTPHPVSLKSVILVNKTHLINNELVSLKGGKSIKLIWFN